MIITKGKTLTYSVAPSVAFPAWTYYGITGGAWAEKTTLPAAGSNAMVVETFNQGYVGWSQSTDATVTVTVDLESALHADRLNLKGYDGTSLIYRPTAIHVEYSDNNSDWTTQENLTGLTAGGQPGARNWIASIDVSDSDHRYWRATLTHGGEWVFLSTFEMVSTQVNIAAGAAYSISPAANASFPDAIPCTTLPLGASDFTVTGGKLTNMEKGNSTVFGSGVGWALATDATGTIRVDLASAMGADYFAVFGLTTTVNMGSPKAVHVQYSDNDSDWTTVVNKTGLTESAPGNGMWCFVADISAEGDHRYWRAILTSGTTAFIVASQVEMWAATASVPSAPTNPAAADQSCSSILVSWDDVSDETGYRVERSPDGSGSWVDVSGNLAANATSYLNTGLSESTQYFYRVIAFNANGDSDPSTVVNDTTPACPPGGRRVIRSPRYGVTRVAS